MHRSCDGSSEEFVLFDKNLGASNTDIPKSKLIPLNLLEEKSKFFDANIVNYNPQFLYRINDEKRENILQSEIGKQETKLLYEAIGILEEAVKIYGNGNVLNSTVPTTSSLQVQELTPIQANNVLSDYLKKCRVHKHCDIKWANNMPNVGTFMNRKSVSYARFMCKDEYFDKTNSDKCKHILYVSTNINRNPVRLESFANHEIGTHLIRRINEEIQPWFFNRKRFYLPKPRGTRQDIQTEEGFACINETINTPEQLLVRPALNYFASALAKTKSFSEIFNVLETYVVDKEKRWTICVNAKRGLLNSSTPGGDGRVQSYFEGAVFILRNIKYIDIQLLFCGKIAVTDHDHLKRVARRHGLIIPPFAANIQEYRSKLVKMSFRNKLKKEKLKSSSFSKKQKVITKKVGENVNIDNHKQLKQQHTGIDCVKEPKDYDIKREAPATSKIVPQKGIRLLAEAKIRKEGNSYKRIMKKKKR